ncbi:MAG: insulinase family protein, partial [Rhodospirillales bacterium]|nr:insulinase family protein [Rhodospirillales bacterium]
VLVAHEFALTDGAGHDYGPHSDGLRAAIEETDHRLGQVLDMLAAKGLLDSTLFVFTSDHGMAAQDVSLKANPARHPERIGMKTVIGEPMIYLRDLCVEVAPANDGRTARVSVLDNDPRARMREQMQAALYLNHPYGRSVIGWEHEMRGLNTADALDWYRRYYAPNNAILIVAGDITAADLKPLAEKYYGPISARPIAPRLRPQEPPPEAARRVTIKDTRVREPSLSRVYLAPSYVAGAREHAYPLEVLAEVLGSGGTSQLYRALVLDRRVATAAGAFYTPDAIDLTRFAMFATPAPGVSPADLEAALDEEIRRVLVEGVSAGDVERAKQRMRASAVFARDSLQTGARVIGTALAIGQTVDDVEAWPDRIGAVTAAEVTAAARYVLREERSVTGVLLPRPGS